MKVRLLLLLLIVCVCGIARAQTLNTPKLDSLFNVLAANDRALGSLTIARNGHVLYSRAIGARVINGAQRTAATPATRYRIGSISKLFTATMIFQLIEEGKLTLATPLATYYPALPNAAAITVGQLLGHRSGLHSFTDDSDYPTYMTQPKTRAEMLALIAQAKPDFAPNEKAAYSNVNYVVLGYIVEKLTGQSYAQALQQRIAAKAHLSDTYYGGKIDPRRQESYSYVFVNGWQPQPETDMSIPGGAGAVVSTTPDLTKFMEALFTGKLVSAASLDQMKTITDGYGMGLVRMPFGSHTLYGHSGVIDGFAGMLAYSPADQLTVAYCTNGVRYAMNDVMIGVLSICYNAPYTIPSFKTLTLTPAELTQYEGHYTSAQNPLQADITQAGSLLSVQPTGQPNLPLEAIAKDTFQFEPAGVVMVFDPARHTFILQQGGQSYLYTRQEGK